MPFNRNQVCFDCLLARRVSVGVTMRLTCGKCGKLMCSIGNREVPKKRDKKGWASLMKNNYWANKC